MPKFGIAIVAVLAALLCTSIFYSCKKQEASNYMVFSGKVENQLADRLIISPLNEKRKIKEIVLSDKGEFRDTLYDLHGYFYFYNENERSTVYLQNGYDLVLNIDATKDNFDESIIYTGSGSSPNNYLAKKYLLNSIILGSSKELYGLEEADYLGKMNNYHSEVLDLLHQVKDTSFVKEEELDLTYEYLYKVAVIYAKYHAVISKKKDFKVSPSYPNVLKGFNFNMPDHFYIGTGYYKDLAMNHRISHTLEKSKTEGISPEKALLASALEEEYEVFKNQSLRVVGNTSIKAGKPIERMEAFYSEIMNNSTDTIYKKQLTRSFEKFDRLSKGGPSPLFSNYENYMGGVNSLEDFKGKYVYIDMWATWCAPCLKEIPHLKKIGKQYQDKNISFVSISVDDAKNHDKWKNMVKNKSLSGIQLFASNGPKSQFYVDYGIKAIPRFILIDPKGNIISSDAPKPSDPKLKELFSEAGI